MPKLSVNLVTWNGAKYIPYLFDSLRKQTCFDWELLVIDNNSQDNTLELVKKELADFPVQWKIIANKENKGFAGGHNQAFKEITSDYVALLNQDTRLAPDCLEKMFAFLDKHGEVAAVSPRLMKWDSDSQIDSLGLKVYRNRRVTEQYAQEDWNHISPLLRGRVEGVAETDVLEVFGVSGTLPMFRVSALKTVVYQDGNIFDEAYHSYKEDVDLAYRLTAAGYKAYVLLDAVAYHDRSASAALYDGNLAVLTNKKTQSELARYHSYKNHLMTLYKNEYWQNFILDFPWILWYELKKFIYCLLFDRKILGGLKEIRRQELAKKRRLIKNLRKINWQAVRNWWI